MKNWLSNWKFRRQDDLESRLRAARPQAPEGLVKAIAGEVRPRSVNARRPLRLGRALAIAGATALVVAAVSTAAGVSLTAGVGNSIVHLGGPSHPSSADQYVVQPHIASISPNHGTVGTTVTITGTGLNGVTAVTINGTAATSVDVVDDSHVTAVVAPGTGATGHIVVTNSAGSDTSTDSFSFAAAIPSNTAVPQITGTPVVGNALTNDNGTWTNSPDSFSYQWMDCDSAGNNCTNITGATGAQYTLASSDLGKTIRVSVTATNAAGDSAASSSAASNAVLGVISAFSPGSGAAGTAVTLTGASYADFLGATAVKFNGTTAQFNANSNTSITAVAPPGSSNGRITVQTPSGTFSTTTDFFVIATPSISSFAPTQGGVGTSVTINGSNFTGASAVKFNTTSTTAFSVNGAGTQITVNVPTGATTGKISVTTSAGTGTSTDNFTVLSLPTVSSFAPTAAVPTTSLTINGTNFQNVSSVTVAGAPATITTPASSPSFNKIVVAVPSIPGGSPAGALVGKVSVTTPAGTATSSGNFTIYAAPQISSFTPATQSLGKTVTVFGSGFLGASSVKLDTSPTPTAVSFTVNNDGQITISLPASSSTLPGHSFHIVVTGPVSTATSTDQLSIVSTIAKPDAFTVSPTSGTPGTPVTLTCNAPCTHPFTGVTSVKFGAVAAQIVSISGDLQTINTAVPATAALGANIVSVTNSGGPTNGTPTFTVFGLPRITSFNPAFGLAGSQSVTINGNNFFASGHQTSVQFGSSPAVNVNTPTTFSAATPITVQVPANAVSGPITVAVAGIGSGVSTASFTVLQAPTITSFTPQVGKSGTVVTVTGTNFVGTMSGRFKFGATTSVTAPVTVVDSTHLKITAPGNPTALTSATLIVHNAAGDSPESTDHFTYPGSPVIQTAGLSPTHGPANSQKTTKVTIDGSHFTGATAVNFGTKPGTIASVSDGEIVAFAPAGAATGMVTVVTPAGTSNGVNFVVDPLPTISSFTPAPPNGVDPGGAITVTGTNFVLTGGGGSVDGLSVNGTSLSLTTGTPAAGQFKVDNATKIEAVLPASGVSTGPITVTNSLVGSATSAASLIVRATPTITSFSPQTGTVGTKVTLTGTNFSGGGITVTFTGDDPSVSGASSVTTSAVTVLSSTTATVNVPTGAFPGTLTVNNSQGSSANSADEFVVILKPAFDTTDPFDPTNGPASAQASTLVSIQGSHLLGVTNVLFNSKPAAFFAVQDDGGIAAMAPVGATTGKITLVSAAGNTVSNGSFTVNQPPVVTSIAPTKGAVGDVVTINGSGFLGDPTCPITDCGANDGTVVDFHGVFGATIDSISSNSIRVEVPAGAVTGPLLVQDIWGQTAVTPQFTVIQPPVISDFFNEFTTQRSGKKGQPVVIFGSGFTGTSHVQFNGTDAPFSVVSDFEIIASIPAGATTGPITVQNAADTATTAPNTFTINH